MFRKLTLQIQQKFGRGVSDNRADRRRTDATYVRNSVSKPHKTTLPQHLNEETENNKVEDWLSTNNNDVASKTLNNDSNTER